MRQNGSKGGSGIHQWIVNQIPPHRHWFELYAGSAIVTRSLHTDSLKYLIDINPTVVERLQIIFRKDPLVTVIRCDALRFIEQSHFTPNDFLYLDPPYPLSVRRSQKRLFTTELSDKDHRLLLDALLLLHCNVAISTYPNPLYDFVLKGWRWDRHNTITRARTVTTEQVYFNYPRPVELADYSYVGEDYTDRRRIARKIARWKAKLRMMEPVERNALLSALRSYEV